MENTMHVQDVLVAVKGYYGAIKEKHSLLTRGLNLGETVAWWAIERADAVLFATNTREPFFKAVGFAEGKANQALAIVYSTQAAVVDRITKAQTAVWDRVEAVRSDVTGRVETVRSNIVAVRANVTDRVEAVRADVQTRVEDVRTNVTERVEGVRTNVVERIESVRKDVAGWYDYGRSIIDSALTKLKAAAGIGPTQPKVAKVQPQVAQVQPRLRNQLR